MTQYEVRKRAEKWAASIQTPEMTYGQIVIQRDAFEAGFKEALELVKRQVVKGDLTPDDFAQYFLIK